MKLRVPCFQKPSLALPSLKGIKRMASQSKKGWRPSWWCRSNKAMGSKARSKTLSKQETRASSSLKWNGKVSALEMQEMEEAFNFFDGNSDGRITEMELGLALRKIGDNPTDKEVREMLKEADTDGDGVISFDEFLSLQSSVKRTFRQEGIFRQDLEQAFLMFDADKDGLISPQELQGVIARLGRPCSLDDCRQMISGVDHDGDGHVNFEEFRSMMMP